MLYLAAIFGDPAALGPRDPVGRHEHGVDREDSAATSARGASQLDGARAAAVENENPHVVRGTAR